MDRYKRLAPTSLSYRVLYYALDGSVQAYKVLAGAALGAAVGRLLAPERGFTPLLAAAAALVAGALGLLLAARMRKAVARVVSPVDLHISWWDPARMLTWAALTFVQGMATAPNRWPAWWPPWWAMGLGACLLLAWRARQMTRQLQRWRRGGSRLRSFRSAHRRRSAQVRLAWLVLFATTVPASVWAAEGASITTLLTLCSPLFLVLALIPLFGPLDLARAMSDSPVPVIDQSWLRWYGVNLAPLWLHAGLGTLAAGFMGWPAALRLAVAGLALWLAAILGMLIAALALKLIAEDIAQGIADGAAYANDRFALYLRPFSADGTLIFEPWMGRRESRPRQPESHDLPREVESALTSALAPVGIPLFAIGGELSQHLVQIERDDSQWYASFCDLSHRALCVFVVLGSSPGLVAELEYLRQRRLLDKVVFVMPPWRSQPALEDLWRQAKISAAHLGMELPDGDPEGALFALDPSGRVRETFPMLDTTTHWWRWTLLRLLPAEVPVSVALAALRLVVAGPAAAADSIRDRFT